MLTYQNGNIKVSLKENFGIVWENGTSGYSNTNSYKLTVRNLQTSKSFSTNYWASIANPYLDSTEDVIQAFQCVLSDATVPVTFEDFCDEFGYDTDSRQAEKVFKTCTKTKQKLSAVLGSESKIYDLANELNELFS